MVNTQGAKQSQSSFFLLMLMWAGLSVSAAGILVGIFFAVQWAVHHWAQAKTDLGYTSSQTLIVRRLPGQTLYLPQNFIRHADHRKDGFDHRLDLAMTWPDLAGFGDSRRFSFAGISKDKPLILMSVQPVAQQPDGVTLLNTVYVHEFSGDTLYGPAGLVGKKLRDPGPFASEIVWYDPLPKNPFVAKCDDIDIMDQDSKTLPPKALLDATTLQSSYCSRTLQVTDALSVAYRFPAHLLSERREMDKAITRRVLGFMVIKSGE